MSQIPAPSTWWERLEALGGRRRDSAVVGIVVAVSVFGGLGMWNRGAPASIAPPARAAPAPTGSSTTSGMLVVHVAGAVRHPGIVELPAGGRIADAVALAGGPLAKADLDQLNLAGLVVDGMQILVPSKGTAGVSSTSTPAATDAATVALNTADTVSLETLPGIGPVTAGAIVAYRTEIGGFDSIDQLLDVTGIGPATLESIRPFISL